MSSLSVDSSQRRRSSIMIYYFVHGKVISADVFHLNNKNYLCIIDYNSKFPVIKKLEGLSAESLITTKIIFAKYGIPQKIMSVAGMNFVSDASNNSARQST